jgi:carboxynorspermidine decarboxylase
MRISEIKTPAYVIDEKKLEDNLRILDRVQRESGAKILLAQKAYSVYQTYPLVGSFLYGATSSGLYEAKLAYEEMINAPKPADISIPTENRQRKLENHVYEPAFEDEEMDELCEICDHIVFNSLNQLEHHRPKWEKAVKEGKLSVGLRINPEHSTQEVHEIYDPCAAGSRLGIRICDMPQDLPEGVDGLHFHTLCEQDLEPLQETFKVAEKRFGRFFPDPKPGTEDIIKEETVFASEEVKPKSSRRIKWINLGGGHHITREDYDIEGLIRFIRSIKEKYDLEVYLEPGEAIALEAGYLVTTVMDIVETEELPVLILDTSASCHMPDVIEMPYRPPLKDSGHPHVYEHTYRLSSRTCLAGDNIGEYSFKDEIKIGDRLYFEDMAIYSMVKNNTFNGMPLPDIDIMRKNGDVEILKHFGYEDFKTRL